VRVAGGRTFVRRNMLDHGLDVLPGYTEQTEVLGRQPSSRVLGVGVKLPSADVRMTLPLAKKEQAILIKRVHMASGEPIAPECACTLLRRMCSRWWTKAGPIRPWCVSSRDTFRAHGLLGRDPGTTRST